MIIGFIITERTSDGTKRTTQEWLQNHLVHRDIMWATRYYTPSYSYEEWWWEGTFLRLRETIK